MANKRLNASIIIGGSITGGLRNAFTTASKSMTQLGGDVRRLSTEQKMLGSSIQTFGRMGKDVDGLRTKYAGVTKELERMRKAHESLSRLENAKAANLTKRGEIRGQMIDAVALGTAVGAPMVAAVNFETAMLGVAKQLEGARDESGQLTQTYFNMATQVKELSRELPIAAGEIAAMVAAGLRMGVASDEVVEFTRRTAEMATAFDAPADQLADSMGKIAGLYGIPITAIGALGDSINYLDDNTKSTGSGIIEYLTRVGGIASAVKVGSNEMAAMGSTLLSLGERTETAGTATNAMFQKFAAADKGTKKFKEAMKEIGLSTAEVQKGMQSDAMGTMLNVLDSISKLDADKRLGVMVELVGLEHSDTMAKLANNTGELRRQLEMANSEAAKGSMGKEFDARMRSSEGQLKILKNATSEMAINLGSTLLPALNSITGALGPAISSMAAFAEQNPKLTTAVVGTVAGLAALKITALGSAYAFTFVKGGALTALTVFNRVRLALPLVGSAMMTLGRVMLANPIGLAVTAIAGGAYLIYKNWEPISGFFTRLWNEPKATMTAAWQWFKDTLSWHPIALVANNWDPVKGYFTGLWSDITSTVGTAIEWITSKIAWVGETWKSTKSFFGMADEAPVTKAQPVQGQVAAPEEKTLWKSTKSFFGMADEAPVTKAQPIQSGDFQPAMTAPGAPAGQLLELPQPALAAASTTYADNRVDHSQVTLNVTQQPGESQDGLIKRITAELEKKKQIRARSNMTDGAYAQ
ncbi:phage tail tape measure protein [Candidimonas sp. SYP-B2681]|uniref:phage tail tape measure protein n=1 Tax=Candidimonas sp. SYP-B2681 TaxID=2497686 RepID=UPI000F87BD35|nr:phage tail tape measure protein [Candidimonas sp. SYP-B2681]RTZ47493.1 phage tail tape measure protein [Candidimonas sp. SYP-B2681]